MKTSSVVSVVDFALRYLQQGFYVVPIPQGSNHPTIKNWQNLRISEEVEQYFSDAGGIGLLLEPSGLVDVDLDCPEAIAAGRILLPPTAMIHGHRSSRSSHHYYRTTGSIHARDFIDPRTGSDDSERNMLVQLRIKGQTNLPPTINQRTGEPIEWESESEPATVNADELSACVSKVASAAQLARYWKRGSRHFAAMALAGMLFRAGWDEDATRNFILVITAAAHDDETASRLNDIATTACRIQSDDTATGAPRLAEIIGDDIVEKVREWLELGRPAGGAIAPPAQAGKVGLVKQLADRISSTEYFAQDKTGQFYRYADGVYIPDGEEHVRRMVKKILEQRNESSSWSSNRADEVAEYLRVDSRFLLERPPLDVLNVANGLLSVDSCKLLPHSPEYLSTVQLPVTYDPAAKCPAWDKFVAEVFPEDALKLAWEIPAWLMIADTSIQKAVLLVGEGANGKSVYLAGTRAFLGSSNVASETLHRLESNRFAVAQLVGKLANICSDLPSASLTGSSVFKQITGGDSIVGERKFKQPFSFVPFSRLVFSANHLPQSADASHAYFRRWVIVPFSRTFDPSEQTPRHVLDARLSAPAELSGVLNRALGALQTIRQRGNLHESKSLCEAGREFVQLTDPVAAWLERETTKHEEAFVSKNALLQAYNDDAVRNGRSPITATAFGLAIKRVVPELVEGQRTMDGERRWVWVGLAFRYKEL